MMDEMPKKPIEPGPTCTEAERHAYAQANAKWSAWLDEHPEAKPPNPGMKAEDAGTEPAEAATHD